LTFTNIAAKEADDWDC